MKILATQKTKKSVFNLSSIFLSCTSFAFFACSPSFNNTAKVTALATGTQFGVDGALAIAAANGPTLVISNPTIATVVTAATMSIVGVSGTCSLNSGTVSIVASIGSNTVVTTATCNTSSIPNFSVTMNLSTLPDGTLAFNANEANSSGVVGKAQAVSVLKVSSPPNAATLLVWSQTSPTLSTSINASWVVSSSASLNDQILQNYTGVSCGTASGNTIDLKSATQAAYTITPGDGAYSYKILSYDSYGNYTTSACSSPLVIDTTAPAAPSMALSTPTNATTSAYSVATFIGTIGLDAGSTSAGTNVTLAIFTDSACQAANSVGAASAVPSASFTLTTSTLAGGGNGLKTFYYKTYDVLLNSTACLPANLSYTYQATPIVSFTRMGYTYQETGPGNLVGTAVSLQRDVCGVQTTVTITTSNVSALSGTNYTANTAAFTIPSDNCATFTIPASNFNLVNASTSTGDLFFRAAITGIVNGAALSITTGLTGGSAPAGQVAQVNIVGSSTTGDYMFNQPLYTANLNSTSVTLYVQRAGSTAAASSVTVSFVDGTAVGGTDYSNAAQTVNFSIGDSEEAVTVPILDTSATNANLSFYVKLSNPSAGTGMRNISVAKVRIMDDNGSSPCSTVGAPFGGGTGATGNPYLICTYTQFTAIASSRGSNFELMADISQSGTGASLGALTGNFDGHEHYFENYNFNNAAVANAALFSQLGTSASGTSTMNNFNLLNASVINTAAGAGVLSASVNNYNPSMNHDLVSGFLKDTHASGDVGLLIANTANGGNSSAFTFTHCLTYGTVKATSTAGNVGGMIGWHNDTNSTTVFSQLYNMANVIGGAQTGASAVGGVFGQDKSFGTVTMNDLENRGVITGSAQSPGGIIGHCIGSTGVESLTNLNNYGAINGTGAPGVGGIIGDADDSGSTSISYANNYAAVTGSSDVGGIVGGSYPGTATVYMAINNSTNSGAITATSISGTDVGGILGIWAPNGAVNGMVLSITGSSNSGTIASTGAFAYGGGIAGRVSFGNTTTSGNYAYIDSVTNSGNVNVSGEGVGGIIGDIDSVAASNAAFTLTNSSSSALSIVSGTTGSSTGGLVGLLTMSGTGFSTLDSNTSASAVFGNSQVGGLIGLNLQSSGASIVIVSNSSVTASIGSLGASPTQLGGLLGRVINTAGTFSMIHSNYSGGTVVGSTASAGYVGGLVGEWDVGSSVSNVLENSFAQGSVSGSFCVGGILGYIAYSADDTITVQDSYTTANVAVANGNPAGGILGGSGETGGATYTLNLTRLYTSGNLSGTGISAISGTYVGTPTVSGAFYLDTDGGAAGLGTSESLLSLENEATFTAIPDWTFGGDSPWVWTGGLPTLP